MQRLTQAVEKEFTSFKQPLSPGLTLAVIMMHLANGDNYWSLAYAFRCGVSSIQHQKYARQLCMFMFHILSFATVVVILAACATMRSSFWVTSLKPARR